MAKLKNQVTFHMRDICNRVGMSFDQNGFNARRHRCSGYLDERQRGTADRSLHFFVSATDHNYDGERDTDRVFVAIDVVRNLWDGDDLHRTERRMRCTMTQFLENADRFFGRVATGEAK